MYGLRLIVQLVRQRVPVASQICAVAIEEVTGSGDVFTVDLGFNHLAEDLFHLAVHFGLSVFRGPTVTITQGLEAAFDVGDAVVGRGFVHGVGEHGVGIKSNRTFILLVQVGAFFGLMLFHAPGRELCRMLLYCVVEHPLCHATEVFPKAFTRFLLPCCDAGLNAFLWVNGIVADLAGQLGLKGHFLGAVLIPFFTGLTRLVVRIEIIRSLGSLLYALA